MTGRPHAAALPAVLLVAGVVFLIEAVLLLRVGDTSHACAALLGAAHIPVAMIALARERQAENP